MNKKAFNKLTKNTTVDVNLIPKQTPYCYTIDVERLRNDKTLKDGELPIKLCPYFVFGKGESRGCLYIKYYGDDLLLYDQCKICDQ